MDATLRRVAEDWLREDPDPATRSELRALLEAGEVAAVRERFGLPMEFGTAGLRGLLGAGSSRMNRAVVRRTTAGLAAYLGHADADVVRRGVVIAYDGRHMSREFAADAAAVLGGAGIPALVFPDLAPTPLAAYAVTALGASAGIMITASHNPPEYNGYKVYWANGAQIIPPHDAGITEAIERVGPVSAIPMLEEAEAREAGLFRAIGPEVADAYIREALALRRRPEVAGDLRIVYTPMHGVGGDWVVRLLDAAGYTEVHPVPEQFAPDGAFPTVRFPNPEEPGAMDLSVALAERIGASLVLANDPDADRLAAAVPRPGGGYRLLNGNEIGCIFASYLLGENPPDGRLMVATTIVSSGLLSAMAFDRGAEYAELLTGFKWIANEAMKRETDSGVRFVFGYEEALGYTVGRLVRDKDGVSAALIMAEIASWCRARGMDLLGMLDDTYRRYGYYGSRQKSLTFPGLEGMDRIRSMMDGLRKRPPTAIAGSPVVRVADVQTGVERDLATGAETDLGLPASNVLRYRLADGSRILVRPSGTEPKIKFYFEVTQPVGGLGVELAEREAGARLAALESDLLRAVGAK